MMTSPAGPLKKASWRKEGGPTEGDTRCGQVSTHHSPAPAASAAAADASIISSFRLKKKRRRALRYKS